MISGCCAGGADGKTVAKRSPEDHVDGRAGFDAPDLVPMNIKNEARDEN